MHYPPDAELKVEYCLYGMYTACISRSIKGRILESFTKPDGKIRFLVATTAFALESMHQSIHWGCSDSCTDVNVRYYHFPNYRQGHEKNPKETITSWKKPLDFSI